MWDFIRLWFNTIWSLFSINFPGFNFSIGSVLIGGLAATLGLRILGKALGTSFDIGGFARSAWNVDKIGKHKKNIRISEERKRDTK